MGKLTAEQRDLLDLEIKTLDESWLRELRDDICSKDFLELKRFLRKEKEQGKTIFPPEADIYSWLVTSSLMSRLVRRSIRAVGDWNYND